MAFLKTQFIFDGNTLYLKGELAEKTDAILQGHALTRAAMRGFGCKDLQESALF
ncbi:MAG: hypothetical protein NTX79_07760 [Candidatus Micrarchaeota archaeon]|nr:hypothetical protein [Candidatus Micrarchaeota archaeon]